MTLRSTLSRVLAEFPSAAQQRFAGHPLAGFIRTAFRDELHALTPAPARYKFQGSAGMGNWARAPWAATFDLLVTDTAQAGYYPVYLFREDMTGVYLSLNQGVTTIRENYRAAAKQALRTRAADFRAQLGPLATEFPATEIDLRPSSPQNDSAYYEAGNICAKLYDVATLPDDALLARDYRKLLELYDLLSYGEISGAPATDEEEAKFGAQIEDLRRFRLHKRVERNAKLARAAKDAHGYACEACGFSFASTYGAIGENFIEAHHLTPISTLHGQALRLDPVADFAVLCANCHRMIHRTDVPHDLGVFRRVHLRR